MPFPLFLEVVVHSIQFYVSLGAPKSKFSNFHESHSIRDPINCQTRNSGPYNEERQPTTNPRSALPPDHKTPGRLQNRRQWAHL
ncbi:hypothetical protein SprV_0401722300 [Sparganum proliferum]